MTYFEQNYSNVCFENIQCYFFLYINYALVKSNVVQNYKYSFITARTITRVKINIQYLFFKFLKWNIALTY